MKQRIFKKQTILVSFCSLAIFGAIFVFADFTRNSTSMGDAKYLENIILGNAEVENRTKNENNNNVFSIIERGFSEKKYSSIISQSKNIFLTPTNKNENSLFFNNQGNFGSAINLVLEISDGTYLQTVYDSINEKLNLVVPNQKEVIGNSQINISEKKLYSLENITPDEIIKFNNMFFYMSNYVNSDTLVSYINNKEISIFRPSQKVLGNSSGASFEDGLWQKDLADCSVGLSGEPEMTQSQATDSSAGLKSLELSSKNHYACTSKSFPIQIDANNVYRLSFDYKNIAGQDVRYYYKLHSEINMDSLGYASAETIIAKDNNWHTYSIIIDPAKVKTNYVHPEFNRKGTDGQEANLASREGISNIYTGDPINDIRYVDIFFYAPSDGSKEVTNLYDNVQMEEYGLVETKKFDLTSMIGSNAELATNIFLKADKNDFKYIANVGNLLDPGDVSFEDGLWQKESGDCSQSMSGESDLGTSLSSDANDGKKSMEISSKNHYACVSKNFPVSMSEGMTYKLQFDYKNIKGGKVMYYYSLNSDDKSNAHSETIDVADHNWHTYENIIDPGISGIKNMDVFFYAPSDGSSEVDNLYDNVRLTEFQPKDLDSYYLHASQQVDESPKLNSVEYKAVNRWKNQVFLHGVKNSFLLVYPEQYSENWKAYPVESQVESGKFLKSLDKYSVPDVESNRQATRDEVQSMLDQKLISASGSKFVSKNFDGSIRNDNLPDGWFGQTWGKATIPEDTHYEVNNYSNSWWVDVDALCKQQNICHKNDDGTYDISLVIENKYNHWLFLALLISGATLLSCLGYLGYDFARRRKNKSNLISPQPPHRPTSPRNSHSLVSSHNAHPPRHEKPHQPRRMV